MANSFGARLSCFAQRAARTRSAVESGPPEIASKRPGKSSSPRNSPLASRSETACSAADTLLFPVNALLHVERGPRIFAQHFAQRSAGRFFFVERRKRHAKLEQRIGRLRRRVVFGGDSEERFSSIAILLALEQTLAKPVLRFRRHAVARI